MTRRKTFDCYLLARANQRPGRRRLIKIARTRFGGIAAAAVGRFSTIRPSLCLSPSLSLSLFPFVPLCPAPNRPARRPRPPLLPPAVPALSARPRLAGPFGVVYAPGIQMTAFARPEECPTISARLRSPTTRLQRGIQPLVLRFSFFFALSLPCLLPPLSLRRRVSAPATCYSGVRAPPASAARASLFTVPVSTDPRFYRIPNAFRPDDCYSYQPLSLIARPRASIVSMNSALNADERDAVNPPPMRTANAPSKSDICHDSCARQKRTIAISWR